MNRTVSGLPHCDITRRHLTLKVVYKTYSNLRKIHKTSTSYLITINTIWSQEHIVSTIVWDKSVWVEIPRLHPLVCPGLTLQKSAHPNNNAFHTLHTTTGTEKFCVSIFTDFFFKIICCAICSHSHIPFNVNIGIHTFPQVFEKTGGRGQILPKNGKWDQSVFLGKQNIFHLSAHTQVNRESTVKKHHKQV